MAVPVGGHPHHPGVCGRGHSGALGGVGPGVERSKEVAVISTKRPVSIYLVKGHHDELLHVIIAEIIGC